MPDHNGIISEKLLSEICEISPDHRGYSDDLLADLHCVTALARNRGFPTSEDLDHAVALLTSVLGRYERQRTEPVWGNNTPRPQSADWLERDVVEAKAKQIVGLLWSESQPSRIAIAVSEAINSAIWQGLIQAREYDAWRAGMVSGSGRRQSVAGTPYGVMRARQLSSKAKSNTSLASATVVSTEPQAPAGSTAATMVARHDAVLAAPKTDMADNTPRETGTDTQPNGENRYEWARQAELVRATNDVLSEGTLDKGVLSKACAEQHIETNGIPGRGSLVKVSSFLAWVAKKCDLAKDEQTQVRNAIIGEISTRNS